MMKTCYGSKYERIFGMKIIVALVIGATLLCARPVFAHHSMAMFDRDKLVELDGTVKDFQWTNPHSWLDIVVPDEKGGEVVWGVELQSLNVLGHLGWKPSTLKPGDKIKVTVHPLKNGDPGGMLGEITLADGKVLSGGGGGQGGAAGPAIN
jgi:hypothetical protein